METAPWDFQAGLCVAHCFAISSSCLLSCGNAGTVLPVSATHPNPEKLESSISYEIQRIYLLKYFRPHKARPLARRSRCVCVLSPQLCGFKGAHCCLGILVIDEFGQLLGITFYLYM